jgi:ribosomal protein L5
MLFWSGFDHFSARLNKIVLHSTSSTICATPELYGSLNVALSCCGGQTPQALKSRKSVAAFKVMAGTLVGGRCVLRRTAHTFCYKWTFLSAAVFDQPRSSTSSSAVGTNFFTFEVGLYDYKAFEPLPGLYVQFDCFNPTC